MSDTIKLAIQDEYGDIKNKKNIILSDNDTLLVKYPEYISDKDIKRIHETIEKALSEKTILIIPKSIEFEVIRKE